MSTVQEMHITTLRTFVRAHARSLRTDAKDLLQRIRWVELRDPEEYRANVAERERLEGLLDALIDYLAEEDRLDEEDGHGR